MNNHPDLTLRFRIFNGAQKWMDKKKQKSKQILREMETFLLTCVFNVMLGHHKVDEIILRSEISTRVNCVSFRGIRLGRTMALIRVDWRDIRSSMKCLEL